jgi:hypothetical protein
MRRDPALFVAFLAFVGVCVTYLAIATLRPHAGSAADWLLLAFICVGPMATGAAYRALRPRHAFGELLALGVACALAYIALNAIWSTWQSVPLDLGHLSFEGWAVEVCTIPLLVMTGGSLAARFQRPLTRELSSDAGASAARGGTENLDRRSGITDSR